MNLKNKCPMCNDEITPEMETCNNCGKNLKEPISNYELEVPKVMQIMKYRGPLFFLHKFNKNLCPKTGVPYTSQFQDRDFALHDYICMENSHDGWEVAIGNYFLVKYPGDWTDEEKYDFSWIELQKESNPINEYNYND